MFGRLSITSSNTSVPEVTSQRGGMKTKKLRPKLSWRKSAVREKIEMTRGTKEMRGTIAISRRSGKNGNSAGNSSTARCICLLRQ